MLYFCTGLIHSGKYLARKIKDDRATFKPRSNVQEMTSEKDPYPQQLEQ